jgi:hypothetical protein
MPKKASDNKPSSSAQGAPLAAASAGNSNPLHVVTGLSLSTSPNPTVVGGSGAAKAAAGSMVPSDAGPLAAHSPVGQKKKEGTDVTLERNVRAKHGHRQGDWDEVVLNQVVGKAPPMKPSLIRSVRKNLPLAAANALRAVVAKALVGLKSQIPRGVPIEAWGNQKDDVGGVENINTNNFMMAGIRNLAQYKWLPKEMLACIRLTWDDVAGVMHEAIYDLEAEHKVAVAADAEAEANLAAQLQQEAKIVEGIIARLEHLESALDVYKTQSAEALETTMSIKLIEAHARGSAASPRRHGPGGRSVAEGTPRI